MDGVRARPANPCEAMPPGPSRRPVRPGRPAPVAIRPDPPDPSFSDFFRPEV